MKNSKEIRRLQKTSYKEGWTYDVGVELRDNMGAHSISSAFENGEDDGKQYANNLLEKILDRNNLNLAYKKVVSNKGSHGVDGMKVDELHLKIYSRTVVMALDQKGMQSKPY